jgi:HK97 family phage prohead protease
MIHPNRERRTIGQQAASPAHYEFRAPVDIQQDGRTIFGYASVFNSLSQDLGGFKEIVKPGAFTRTLADGLEKFCLWSHDQKYILGAISNNTLILREDHKGLYFEATIPENVWYAQGVANLLIQKYIKKCSFGFRCYENGSSWLEDKSGAVTRFLDSVQLFEVSVLGDPAYTETEADCRTALSDFGSYKRKYSALGMRLKLLELSI